jgi:hypothetical protein
MAGDSADQFHIDRQVPYIQIIASNMASTKILVNDCSKIALNEGKIYQKLCIFGKFVNWTS